MCESICFNDLQVVFLFTLLSLYSINYNDHKGKLSFVGELETLDKIINLYKNVDNIKKK